MDVFVHYISSSIEVDLPLLLVRDVVEKQVVQPRDELLLSGLLVPFPDRIRFGQIREFPRPGIARVAVYSCWPFHLGELRLPYRRACAPLEQQITMTRFWGRPEMTLYWTIILFASSLR